MIAKYRALIIGPGSAGTAVMNEMKKDGRAEPVAFVETRTERIEQLKGAYPDAIIGTDYVKILQTCRPDVVVAAGPDYLHGPQCLAALEAGCHVLIEKPMATSVEDARKLLEAEERTGKIIMVDYTMRYSHPWGAMMQAAKEGRIGKIFYLAGFYIHDMWNWYDEKGKRPTPWRIDKDNPQNILFGGGCHGLDMVLYVMEDDPVSEVYCCGNRLSGSDMPIEDCFLVSMKFASGAIGLLSLSSLETGYESIKRPFELSHALAQAGNVFVYAPNHPGLANPNQDYRAQYHPCSLCHGTKKPKIFTNVNFFVALVQLNRQNPPPDTPLKRSGPGKFVSGCLLNTTTCYGWE